MNKKIFRLSIILILYNIFKGALYFITKLTPISAHLIGINLDKETPLYSWFVWFYVTWYLVLIIVPLILYFKDEKLFYKYLVLDIICLVFDLTIYIIYPTIIERPVINGNGISDLLLKLIYFLDTPACNCLPSEHCVWCFIFMYVFSISKNIDIKYKIINIVLNILIILSTLFIHQHVIYDVIAAFTIVVIAYILNRFFKLEKLFYNKFTVWFNL
jgi:hypothetical protein